MRLELSPARKAVASDRIVFHVADAALVLPFRSRPVGSAGPRPEAPVAGEGVQALVEAHLACRRVMVLDQRPSVVEQHRLRHVAKIAKRRLYPSPIAARADTPHEPAPGVAECRDTHADMHPRLAKIDLQLLARRRLEPGLRPPLSAQRLP
jgi:hypothetical protein